MRREYSRGHSRSGVVAKAKRLMMSQQVETPHSRIAATYKAREVEGALDVYFYRPLGFRVAEFFAHLKVTPAGVSLLAGLCGIIAGHLYFYRNLGINIAGMIFHVCANALDNADGQLARLTRQESRKGRIIDSVADHLGIRERLHSSDASLCVCRCIAGDLAFRSRRGDQSRFAGCSG